MDWNLLGKKFNSLEVTKEMPHAKQPITSYTCWLCLCECGEEIVLHGAEIASSMRRSCGCKRATTKGHRGKNSSDMSPTYISWKGMKTRCLNPNNPAYHHYGGRGITVCDRWLEFPNFLEDMGERPEGTWIDRIDNDGNYEPGNCRWATPKEQANNKKRRVK